MLQKFVDHLLRIGVRLIHLVDGDDQRRARGVGMVDGLDGLRHDAVVGRHHQHHNVGHVGSPGAHGAESGVARGVEEGDALAVGQMHLIGADVLGDAAVFAPGDVGGSERVEQAGLAVVHVTHDSDHRSTRQGIVLMVLGRDEAGLDIAFGYPSDGMAELGGDQLGGVGVEHVVDLKHGALTHQVLDDVDTAHGHSLAKIGDRDGVGDHHLTRRAGQFARAAALALLLLALSGPANRSQRAHPFGAVLVSGYRLDGQPALAAAGLALGARDGLAVIGGATTTIIVIERSAFTGARRRGPLGLGDLRSRGRFSGMWTGEPAAARRPRTGRAAG